MYKEELNSINMTLLKPTQMDTNIQVMMPGPRSASEEAIMDVRRAMWMQETDRFLKEHCEDDGTPKEGNLSKNVEKISYW